MTDFKLIAVLLLCVGKLQSKTAFTEFVVGTLKCDSKCGEIFNTSSVRYFPLCVHLCEVNENCLSALYQQTTNVCQTRTQVLSSGCLTDDCGKTVKYAERKTDLVIEPSLIKEPCSDNSSCPVPNSACVDGVCKCLPGYSYDFHIVLCVAHCGMYGRAFQFYPNSRVVDNNQLTVSGISEYECAEECINEGDFVCRSFDYVLSNRTCQLSSVTGAAAAIAWAPVEGVNYRQRDCR